MENNSVEVIVRFAERTDCEAIECLKKELAIHQNMKDRPKLSAKELVRDGFDRNPPCFQCLVAESITKADSGEVVKKVVGYALYYYAYASWEGKVLFLEDLCVTSKLRGMRIGEKLIKRLAQIGVEKNFARIQLEVFDWNETAIKFYKKLGAINFTEFEGWHDFSLDSNALKQLVNENN